MYIYLLIGLDCPDSSQLAMQIVENIWNNELQVYISIQSVKNNLITIMKDN